MWQAGRLSTDYTVDSTEYGGRHAGSLLTTDGRVVLRTEYCVLCTVGPSSRIHADSCSPLSACIPHQAAAIGQKTPQRSQERPIGAQQKIIHAGRLQNMAG